MYSTWEKCMNPNSTDDVCLECGLCGRTFIDHELVSDRSCAFCKNYDDGMSECGLRTEVLDMSDWKSHGKAFVRKNDTCDCWEPIE